jgi:hypothetical protein
MTLITPHVVDHLRNDPATTQSVQQQLRELDKEYREKLVELNKAEACFIRARKLDELSYHRRRRAILANGHDDAE